MVARTRILVGSGTAIVLLGGGLAVAAIFLAPPGSPAPPPAARASGRSGSSAITTTPTPGPTWAVSGVDCSGTTCIATGYSPRGHATLWWSHDGGVTFHVSSGSIPTHTFLGEVTCQRSTCIALGVRAVSPHTQQFALASANAGRTFVPTTLPHSVGPDQLACSTTLCLLAESPAGSRGRADVYVSSSLRGPWEQLDLPLASVSDRSTPRSTIVTSGAAIACSTARVCLIANVTTDAVGQSGFGTVWALTSPTSTPVVVARSTTATQTGTDNDSLECGPSTCAALLHTSRSGYELTNVAATTQASTSFVQTTTAPVNVLSCVHSTCITAELASPGAPVRLSRITAKGPISLHNPLPGWIEVGFQSWTQPTASTLLVPAPANGGSLEASLLRLELSPRGIAPKGFVTLPAS